MSQITCISDIHGAYWTMRRLLAQIPDVGQLVFCGDLVDRGPNSRLVVEYAMKHKIPTVMGNHEHLCLYHHQRIKSEIYDTRKIWLVNGGQKALDSWERAAFLPDDVLDWMAELPYYLEYGELLVSHTGHGKLAKGRSDVDIFGREDPLEMLLWYRDTHFEKDGKYRVLGHSPREDKQPEITDSWAMIDTAAAYGGGLTAFQWPSKRVWYQPYDETPL